MSTQPISPIKICVIGAGPSGLVTSRYLSQNPNHQVTVFDSKPDLGGLWYYEEKNSVDPKFSEEKMRDNFYRMYGCFQASMYASVKTNIPYYLMAYKDLNHADVDKDTPLFIDVPRHFQYLSAYAEKFDLKQLMTLNTVVKSVRLYSNLTEHEQAQVRDPRKFTVRTIPSTGSFKNAKETVHSFDYVVICAGVNTKPHIPLFENQAKFSGCIMPSKDFRSVETPDFQKKTVMIYGGSYSAMDLLIQILANEKDGLEGVKKVIYVGRRVSFMKKSEDWIEYRKSGRLEIVQGEISEFLGGKDIKFSNGMTREVDTVLLCCGYELSFPFLDLKKDKFFDFNPEEHNGKFIGPLYKRMFPVREPDLMLICNSDLSTVGAFISEAQAMVAKHVIEGNLKLPSKEEMMRGFDEDVKQILEMGQPLRKYYTMPRDEGDLDFEYWEDMRNWLKTILPSDEEKAVKFAEKMRRLSDVEDEYFLKGNFISYRRVNFREVYDPEKDVKYTSEFV